MDYNGLGSGILLMKENAQAHLLYLGKYICRVLKCIHGQRSETEMHWADELCKLLFSAPLPVHSITEYIVSLRRRPNH